MLSPTPIINRSLANCRRFTRPVSIKFKLLKRSLIVRYRYQISLQKQAFCMQALITWPLDPPGTTSSVCRKSPQKQTILPPNYIPLFPQISWRLRFIVSISKRFCIGDLFQKIISACLISFVKLVPLTILHKNVVSVSDNILKREWAVRLPCNNIKIIPDDITARAIRCSARSFYITLFWTIVLLVPSSPLKENIVPSVPNSLSVLLFMIASRIVSAASRWSGFSRLIATSASSGLIWYDISSRIKRFEILLWLSKLIIEIGRLY